MLDTIILELFRKYDNTKTTGTLTYKGLLICATLELPWKENMKSVSCVPEGIYPIEIKNNQRIKVKNVQDRSAIQIHTGNTLRETKGCILVGLEQFQDTIYLSQKAMDHLQTIIRINDRTKFKIHIKS